MISEIFSAESFFWTCLWQSTIFIAAGLLGSFILRHRSARAHQVLLLAIIAAVAVPVISILVKHYELGMFEAKPATIQSQPKDQIIYETAGITSVENIEHKPGTVEKDLTSIITAPEKTVFPLRSVVLYGWLAVSLVLAFRLAVTFILGVRLLGRAMPLDCNRIEQAVHLAKAKLRINKDVMIYSNDDVRSPVIWCWKRKPILLLPSAAGLSENRIDWTGILCHELAHYKRRDHITGFMAELLVCLMPWHPLLWWAKTCLIRFSEQACDDWVVATDQPCTDYAESLLDLTPCGQMAFVPAVVSNKKGLAGRIHRILKNNCPNPRTGAVWALAVGIVAICITVGVAFAQTRPAKPQTASEHEKKPAKSLQEAAIDGDVEQIRWLLSTGASVNVKDNDNKGRTALHHAARKGHTEIIRLLIAQGADVNAKDENDRTPLHSVAEESHADIAKFLIANGADVNAKDKKGYTPLHYAIHYENKDIIKLLITKGADVNAMPKGDSPPLHYAIWNEDVELAKLLVNHGAKFNLKDQDGWTAFRYAVAYGNRELLEFFIAKGAKASEFHKAAWLGDLNRVKHFVKQGTDVNTKDDQLNWTPLHWVAFTGQQDVVEFLLAKGASVNVKDEFNTTPLHHAAVAGHRELVDLFLSKGAKVNAKDDFGTTPLREAARSGHREVAELLIASGADVNAKYPDGHTPLHPAAEKGYKEVVELLIAKGADINAKDENGWTPLHWACWRERKDMAEFLIAKGADVNSKNQDGRTPLDVATILGDKDMAALLIAKGADINTKNRWGNTPLHIVVSHRGDKDMAALLIAKGADVNAKNKWDRTPLVVAKSRGYKKFVELLRKHGAKE